MLANAGVPMLVLHLPAMIVLLLPIIAIEVLVGRRFLPLAFSPLMRGVTGANVISTLLGIPLTWVLMMVLNIVTTGGEAKGLATLPGQLASVVLQSAWLVPYEADLNWMVPAATLVLLVPYFLASVVIEYVALKSFWKTDVPARLWAYVWLANGMTYGLLALGNSVVLLLALALK